MIHKINKVTKQGRVAAFSCCLLFCAFYVSAQDIGQLSVEKGVKINGSVNLNTIGYYVNGIEHRRDPFNWFATGNLNIDLFGYSAPFSLVSIAS